VPKIKSRIEHLSDLRNTVCGRLVEWEANVIYWNAETKRLKANTQGRVDAENNKANNESNVRKDSLYLKCIDQLIEQEKQK